MVEAHEQAEGKGLANGWNFGHVWVAFIVAILLQSLILPCLCAEGTVKGMIALGFDTFVAIRVAIAWLRNETGRGWLFYTILLYTSAFWIEGIVWIFMRNR
jgi:hypothetical protein